MRRTRWVWALGCALLPRLLAHAAEGTPSAEEAQRIAKEAYVFGLPFVENYRRIGPALGAPNRFQEAAALDDDTLEARAILDLRAEPVVLRHADMGERYFSVQLVALTTDNLPYVGTRATGNGAGTFVLAGPEWKGQLPEALAGAKVIRSPSELVVALARVAVDGEADLPAALAAEQRITVTPLSELGGPAPRAVKPVAWLPPFDAKGDAGLELFRYVNFVTAFHRFAPEEVEMLARLARIGVEPGRPFDAAALAPGMRAALERGVKEAREEIASGEGAGLETRNGWALGSAEQGRYRQDYLLRAQVAWSGLYASSPQEVISAVAKVDGRGQPLDGSQGQYVLRFPAGTLPEAEFFWSLTVHDARTHQRFAGLKPGADGTVTVRLQRASPGKAREAGWLPTPDGPFSVVLRIHGPKDVHYVPPAIERAASTAQARRRPAGR